MPIPAPHRESQKGISLILIAIALIILSILSVTLLHETKRDSFWQPKVQTVERLERVRTILLQYYGEYGVLPCPADLTAAEGDADFGTEGTPAAECEFGTLVDIGSGDYAVIGAMPFNTLHLGYDYGTDHWGNKITYAVSRNLTPVGSGGNGVITVTRDGSAVENQAAFVIISHGPDSKGAYSMQTGSLRKSCMSEAGRDQQNCNQNGTFRMETMYMDSGSRYFDDLVTWSANTP